ncbi:MAG: CCA tRNA nucleotidyltransferase [Halobacteriales archaeon]|nr:CCA tRNA nucleotidyltransferase [Halobacteriales archaeon]
MTADADESDRDEVLDAVLEEVSPSEKERDELREAYEAVRRRAENALDEAGVEGNVTLVGSTARDTWLSGDRDIDVFLLLPPELNRDGFETVGLDVGKAVFPDGTVEYAEHPYVQGDEDGYDVDIVPCYDLDSPDELRSAVDRTPFHNEYVREVAEQHDGFGDEVRLLKAFARGAGVYGSDLRTRGFSGYLCELLVHHYGDFESVVEAAADWNEGAIIDIEGHGTKAFDDPLVVIDPTDPKRNVASVVSQDAFAYFVDASRGWLETPDDRYFFPEETEPMDANEFAETLGKRETRLVAVVFEAPDVVEDQLYPQLRKTRRSLVEELERKGFDVVRSDAFADENAVVLVEANVGEQSRVEKHVGPPVHVREHATAFVEKYDDADVVGPYIEDGRYVVERERKYTNVESFVRSDDFFGVGMGKHVETKMREGYDVLVNDDCAALLDEFGVELARYFEPTPVE